MKPTHAGWWRKWQRSIGQWEVVEVIYTHQGMAYSRQGCLYPLSRVDDSVWGTEIKMPAAPPEEVKGQAG